MAQMNPQLALKKLAEVEDMLVNGIIDASTATAMKAVLADMAREKVPGRVGLERIALRPPSEQLRIVTTMRELGDLRKQRLSGVKKELLDMSGKEWQRLVDGEEG